MWKSWKDDGEGHAQAKLWLVSELSSAVPELQPPMNHHPSIDRLTSPNFILPLAYIPWRSSVIALLWRSSWPERPANSMPDSGGYLKRVALTSKSQLLTVAPFSQLASSPQLGRPFSSRVTLFSFTDEGLRLLVIQPVSDSATLPACFRAMKTSKLPASSCFCVFLPEYFVFTPTRRLCACFQDFLHSEA